MKERVQIWMSRDDVLALKELLGTKAHTETEGPFVEGGPMDPLYAALDAACGDSINRDDGDDL